MAKKILIGLVVLVLAGAGFGVYWYISYQNSPDRLANDFVDSLKRGDVAAAKSNFTPFLQSQFDDEYWEQNFVSVFKGYTGKTTVKKEIVQRATSQPSPDPALLTGVWRFTYEIQLGDLPFQLELLIIKQDNQWRIHQVTGSYRV